MGYCQSSLRDSRRMGFPGAEAPGYYRKSLRDGVVRVGNDLHEVLPALVNLLLLEAILPRRVAHDAAFALVRVLFPAIVPP